MKPDSETEIVLVHSQLRSCRQAGRVSLRAGGRCRRQETRADFPQLEDREEKVRMRERMTRFDNDNVLTASEALTDDLRINASFASVTLPPAQPFP
jgi:hypothetical protein